MFMRNIDSNFCRVDSLFNVCYNNELATAGMNNDYYTRKYYTKVGKKVVCRRFGKLTARNKTVATGAVGQQ